MTKTVVLTDIIIEKIYLDYVKQCATVDYLYETDTGEIWKKDRAFFWVTIPPEPPDGYPDSWFQLPASYFSTLISLRNDADDAISARFLV